MPSSDRISLLLRGFLAPTRLDHSWRGWLHRGGGHTRRVHAADLDTCVDVGQPGADDIGAVALRETLGVRPDRVAPFGVPRRCEVPVVVDGEVSARRR